jgi:hypothetical protein
MAGGEEKTERPPSTGAEDPHVARSTSQRRRLRDARLDDCRRLVHGAGHAGGAAHRRANELFVLSGPGVHADLTGLGWSGATYESWLATTVETLLGAG